MYTPIKIDAILLNIKINQPKLVNMCRYKLATCWQNFKEIYLTWVKILQKVLGGLLFLTHTVVFRVGAPCLHLRLIYECWIGNATRPIMKNCYSAQVLTYKELFKCSKLTNLNHIFITQKLNTSKNICRHSVCMQHNFAFKLLLFNMYRKMMTKLRI